MIPAWQLLRCHMFVYLKWEATSPVFLHDINHKYKWQDWIECLNTDASTNKSIIVKIKCQPLFILFRNVSSTQRSFPYWRDTMLWWRHKKPSSQFLWLLDQWTFLWINDDLDLIRLHLSQEANSINHSATEEKQSQKNFVISHKTDCLEKLIWSGGHQTVQTLWPISFIRSSL